MCGAMSKYRPIPPIPSAQMHAPAKPKPRALDQRAKFWLDKSWPLDPAGYVFLARAFHRIGQARYGKNWTGYEPYTPTYRASTFSIFDLAKKSKEDLTSEEQEWLAGTARDRKAAEADPEGFAAALQARHKARQQEELLAEQRAAAAQIEIITKCESGDLISAWRPASGGKMEPIPAHYWNGAVQ